MAPLPASRAASARVSLSERTPNASQCSPQNAWLLADYRSADGCIPARPRRRGLRTLHTSHKPFIYSCVTSTDHRVQHGVSYAAARTSSLSGDLVRRSPHCVARPSSPTWLTARRHPPAVSVRVVGHRARPDNSEKTHTGWIADRANASPATPWRQVAPRRRGPRVGAPCPPSQFAPMHTRSVLSSRYGGTDAPTYDTTTSAHPSGPRSDTRPTTYSLPLI